MASPKGKDIWKNLVVDCSGNEICVGSKGIKENVDKRMVLSNWQFQDTPPYMVGAKFRYNFLFNLYQNAIGSQEFIWGGGFGENNDHCKLGYIKDARHPKFSKWNVCFSGGNSYQILTFAKASVVICFKKDSLVRAFTSLEQSYNIINKRPSQYTYDHGLKHTTFNPNGGAATYFRRYNPFATSTILDRLAISKASLERTRDIIHVVSSLVFNKFPNPSPEPFVPFSSGRHSIHRKSKYIFTETKSSESKTYKTYEESILEEMERDTVFRNPEDLEYFHYQQSIYDEDETMDQRDSPDEYYDDETMDQSDSPDEYDEDETMEQRDSPDEYDDDETMDQRDSPDEYDQED
eukprot:gene11978-13981_t